MLAPDYPIHTPRLLLRPLDPDTDAEAVHVYQSRPDVCRYIPAEPRTLDEVREWISARRSTIEHDGQGLGLAVVDADTDRVIGDVMLFWSSKQHGAGEIGYVFDPAVRGHGYATEACEALLRLGFDVLGLHRMVAKADARNERSAAVLRRIGMRQEAYLVQNEWSKGEWTDEIDFAILAEEWRERQASA